MDVSQASQTLEVIRTLMERATRYQLLTARAGLVAGSLAGMGAITFLALDAAGQRASAAARRGVQWLIDTQRADGTWDEPQYTGTGFPSDFYINYHLYRLVFPLMALGRCAR